jgi:amino acid permease
MNKESLRNFVVGGTLFIIAAFVFLMIETRSRAVGIAGIIIIIALLFLSVYITPKKTENKTTTENENE